MRINADAEEVGALLSRRPATIQRWVREGRIPCSRGDGGPVFDLEAVARWAEKEGEAHRRGRPRRKVA